MQVSLLTRQIAHSPHTSQELFVYDIPTGTLSICSFGHDHSTCIPQHHFWDQEHPLLLACEVARTGNQQQRLKAATAAGGKLEVATLFATPQGIVLQDCQAMDTFQA